MVDGSVVVTWSMPLASQLNGVLTHYVVQYKTIHNAAEAKAACSDDG